MQSEQINDLAAALSKAQGEMPTAKFNSTNKFLGNKYADLGAVIEASRPVLVKHGLSVSQLVIGNGEHIGVETILLHSSGQWISSVVTLPAGDEKGKSMAQVAGSIVSYLRRYALSAILGIYADEDSDGNQSKQEQRKQERKPVTTPRPAEVVAAELGYDTQVQTQAQPTNGNARPYAPAALFAKIEERSKAHATKVAPTRLRQAIASALDGIFDGDKTKRYELCKWLTGKASTKDIPDAYVHALSDWLGVNDYGQPPVADAMAEARAALGEALKASGQQELL